MACNRFVSHQKQAIGGTGGVKGASSGNEMKEHNKKGHRGILYIYI